MSTPKSKRKLLKKSLRRLPPHGGTLLAASAFLATLNFTKMDKTLLLIAREAEKYVPETDPILNGQ